MHRLRLRAAHWQRELPSILAARLRPLGAQGRERALDSGDRELARLDGTRDGRFDGLS